MDKSKEAGAPKRRISVTDNPSGIAGTITLDEAVVASIAGLAAKEIEGIYSVGKSTWYTFGDNPARGVDAEVGQIQAAFDLDIVVEYGHDVREVAKMLRQRTATEVKKMTGREVIELNVHVIGIHLPDDLKAKPRRVL